MKSRDLSPYQYFQILQVEWIVAELRYRIYQNEKDQQFWNKVKEGKKRVIEEIADKNRLPTIFIDDEMKRIFEAKVYVEKGLPKFTYRDDEHRAIQEPLDLAYYYSSGAEVRFELFGEMKIGIVKSYVPFEPIVYVKDSEGKTYDVPVAEVSRIL